MDIRAIKARSELTKQIRLFFEQHDYVEVSTPILSPTLIPESTIAAFATQYISDINRSRELYLVPSPEIFMKPLLKEIGQSIYQISKCFRNKEQLGHLHNIEFTMLEYYTKGADDIDSIRITEELLQKSSLKGTPDYALPPFIQMSVREATKKYASIDLDNLQTIPKIREAATTLGLSLPKTIESWEDTFHRIFLTFVEPNLPTHKPVILTHYPHQIECLAKQIPHTPYRKRWEMYIGGVEIANCYDEEIDRDKVKAFYEKEYAKLVSERNFSADVIPDIDYSFADIFDSTYPQSSGVAIGLDRLLMVQLGRNSLRDLILFPLSDMLTFVH